MKLTIETASDPQWVDAQQTAITLQVKFCEIQDLMPFCAMADDLEEHGRALFEMAVSGEFGPVAEYVPPTPLEMAILHNAPARTNAMALATDQARHCEMMCDWDKAQEWRTYYQQLYPLKDAPEWPQVAQWPAQPTDRRISLTDADQAE